ncbi:DUF222 domain-containing protein [Microbacterium sp. CJ88]|uniref:HNH endonuclease signature motif containing protein n=1 Tax=Microbacterium sp. CJ88 TaxID=3445672 RepID=UPI003F656828
MEELLAHLVEMVERTRAEVAAGLGGGQILQASDDQLLQALRLAAEVGRLLDAVLVEATGEVVRRSEASDRDARLTTKRGCRDASELLQRVTLGAPATAARWIKAARSVRVGVSFAGEPMPGRLPAMRDALLDGFVGVDGLLAVAAPLEAMGRHVGREEVRLADAVLAAEARGEGPDGAPPACADLLQVQARAWAAALDQDGAEPAEDRALRLRGLTFGSERDGGVPFRGVMLPEVYAQYRRIADAIGSPRVDDGVRFHPSEPVADSAGVDDLPIDDPRSWAQKQHDALATALFTAASSELLPTIGGAAPTLMVSVREEDLLDDRGWAHVDSVDLPVSTAAARHAGCAGVVQRVLLGDNGRILRIGTEERVFNRHQRRAIALRDGRCLIPGCRVPAAWCEIHHVTEHAVGGPTHTDNGVLLCWFHHRFIDKVGWRVRMNLGVPEVLAPPWIDPYERWRAVTTSRTRMLDLVGRRT